MGVVARQGDFGYAVLLSFIYNRLGPSVDIVAGRFLRDGKHYWLLMSEVALPEEKPPHLRLVA